MPGSVKTFAGMACALVMALGLTGCTGSVTVSIAPEDAITAGAQWQVDNSGWHNSGETVEKLSTGDHVVSYKTTPG